MTADEFRDAMDNDKAFQSKRKALVFISLLLLALAVSGAQIKEANTFIFKIEFSNHVALNYLLAVAVLACLLRYYSYAERYRDKLFEIWSSRLLGFYTVYHVDYDGEVSGLLGSRVNSFPGEEFDFEKPKYRKTGFLKRSIGLPATRLDEDRGQVFYTKYFELNEYSSVWKAADFRRLLLQEFKCRAEAWMKYRETLDLVSPYLLALSSLAAFFVNLCLHSST